MRDDAGFTLVELALSLVIMSAVIALFVPTLLVLVHGESSVGALSDANTKIQPAIELLQNQVNSATVLYDPVNNPSSYYHTTTPNYRVMTRSAPIRTDVQPGFALLLYTVAPNGNSECSQWRVFKSSLQYRVWTPASATTLSLPTAVPFRDAAVDVSITNTTRSRTVQMPFQLAGATAPQDAEVAITLWLSPSKNGARLQYRTSDAVQGATTKPRPGACAVPPTV